MPSVPPPAEAPWHAAFPAPKSSPRVIPVSDLHQLLHSHLATNPILIDRPSFLIVDVRRTDFDIAFIRTAINLPAQSFHPLLSSLLPLLSSYSRVVFHCQTSKGRGTRAAAWYQDALDERGIGPEISRAEILGGGIVRWTEEYGEDGEMTTKLALVPAKAKI